MNKDIYILMLASPELLKLEVPKMIKTFNSISNIVSVEIKPYSTNQANQLKVSDEEFENFVKEWISYPKNFEFVNLKNIQRSLDGKYNAYSDDHIYITPSGKFGVLEFDSKSREFFLELDSIKDYFKWSDIEKNRVRSNSFCKRCDYLGKCLTEHYREVTSLDKSCNGFRNLLDWYKHLQK